jgi:hypothetical protein
VVTATNNQLRRDVDGEIVYDSWGNPDVEYGVGEGLLLVTPGG